MIGIKDGKVHGVKFVKANAIGGPMGAPKFILLHETAGRIEKGSSVKWFASRECKVSAHFTIERDGEVVQQVPLDRKAFHAGVSKWKGVSGLNSCSIGIELVGPGKMDSNGKAWFGKACDPSEIVFKPTPQHGDGHWLPFTPAQIAAVKLLCTLIVEEYPDCNEILTHWEVSPGRKVDPNPLFPLREVRKAVLDPDPADAEAIEETVAPVTAVAAPKKIEAAKELVAEGAKSQTVRWSIAGLFAWLETQLGFFQSFLPDAQKEAGDIVNPLTSLGKMVKVNIGSVTVVIVALVFLIVIYRHSRDKVELTKLKGDAP